jgi:hypothetical protein
MLDLVTAVAEVAKSDAEVIATVVHLINSGKVRLAGRLRGAHFDLRTLPRLRAAAA